MIERHTFEALVVFLLDDGRSMKFTVSGEVELDRSSNTLTFLDPPILDVEDEDRTVGRINIFDPDSRWSFTPNTERIDLSTMSELPFDQMTYFDRVDEDEMVERLKQRTLLERLERVHG